MKRKSSDMVSWATHWDIYKFRDPDGAVERASKAGADVLALEPYAHEQIDGNCTLDEGRMLLIDLIAGTGSGVPWDATHAHLGIGDGAAPAEPSQSGLTGANKAFAPMDATWPQRMGATCTWRATFGPNDANFLWNEGTIINGSDDSAVCLNRKVHNRGMKFAGETWIMGLAVKFKADLE